MYLFIFLVAMLHVGKADATARKCRCYSKEVPTLQQGSADATRGIFLSYLISSQSSVLKGPTGKPETVLRLHSGLSAQA